MANGDEPERILQQAMRFHQAQKILESSPNDQREALVQPVCVLAAFTIELLLKCRSLYDWQFARLRAFENAADIDAHLTTGTEVAAFVANAARVPVPYQHILSAARGEQEIPKLNCLRWGSFILNLPSRSIPPHERAVLPFKEGKMQVASTSVVGFELTLSPAIITDAHRQIGLAIGLQTQVLIRNFGARTGRRALGAAAAWPREARMTDQTLHVASLAPLLQNPQNILHISNQLTDNQNLVDQHSQGKQRSPS